MPTGELVKPDEVITPDGTVEVWDEPCPNCDATWSSGPEKDAWGRWHCWRCGYQPGQAITTVPGGPAQPDWARLVNDAVSAALKSEPQVLAVAMTEALGQQGLADLARQQQETLGMAPPPAPPAPGGS